LKLLDDSWYFRQRERLPEWIARGDGAKGRLARLGIVIGGVFLLFYVARDRAPTTPGDVWWVGPAILSSILVALFALWRLIEWRRRVERRKNPPVRTLDLH
jgi:membrane protein implicated in regulation of membrane protease activity